MSASLSELEMITEMQTIMNGGASDEYIKNFLLELSARGETIDEITGAAKVLREKALKINAPVDAVDCCGTGGDKSGTYNISTAVAIVSAACGVPVAKHGNRASSSKSGAADVLEALGVNLNSSQQHLEEALVKFNFAFLMAPKHHRAMKHVAGVRKEIGQRTIFNILGPLINPAGAKFQLLGVYSEKLLMPMAQVLKRLGTSCAWVVHGTDGLDEITTTAPTKIAVLDNGQIIEKELTPQDFGLPASDPANLIGGDAQENANALRGLLNGHEGAYRDIVVANTSAVLNIHGSATSLKDGVAKAQNAIDTGAALDVLNNYCEFTKKR